ncbi:Homeobox protein HD1 [Sesamum angolense]|uniref:Homeobox protein HD1 n=1 Tax=Sesamum angolense TaxID=2727404 RepID=A0AAE1W9Q7_9LAMI|nr:Homeobox protein HD1 [Sesamum angolense]
MQEQGMGMMGCGGIGGLTDVSMAVSGEQHHQLKAEIATHPLYEQLLSAHVSCLRVATPIDQLPLIDAQLSQSHHLLRSYAQNAAHHSLPQHQRQELDNFLVVCYMLVLCSFREQLQQHVRVHAVEAVMACREIEQNLQSLTGASLGEGTGATMSDDEDELQMDFSFDQSGGDGQDLMGFGPLLPTESERSLMERVRQELKIELKQGFKSRIEDEDDKAKLVEQTGLQLKQINILVHQPEEAELAQQFTVGYVSEVQAQEIDDVRSVLGCKRSFCVHSIGRILSSDIWDRHAAVIQECHSEIMVFEAWLITGLSSILIVLITCDR